MIVVSGYLRLEANVLQQLRPLGRETVLATRAEDGCIVYAFSEDFAEPGVMRIYEEWETQAHLDAHGKTAHIARWREALGGVEILERELKLVEIAAFSPFA